MLKEIIKNRPVAILLHGSSLNELEERINEFKDFDICWSGMGNFPTHEQYILSKINKHHDFIFDCATVPESRYTIYEPIRQGRIRKYLERKENNLWVTTHGMIRDQYSGYTPIKTMLIDDIFPKDEIPHYMNVPNSATLHIATALFGGASAIYIFGLDGYIGDIKRGYEFYYKPIETIEERVFALGTLEDPGINRDSLSFDERVTPIVKEYRKLFINEAPIYNCSPNTIYNCFEKLNYDEAIRKLAQ